MSTGAFSLALGPWRSLVGSACLFAGSSLPSVASTFQLSLPVLAHVDRRLCICACSSASRRSLITGSSSLTLSPLVLRHRLFIACCLLLVSLRHRKFIACHLLLASLRHRKRVFAQVRWVAFRSFTCILSEILCVRYVREEFACAMWRWSPQ